MRMLDNSPAGLIEDLSDLPEGSVIPGHGKLAAQTGAELGDLVKRFPLVECHQVVSPGDLVTDLLSLHLLHLQSGME